MRAVFIHPFTSNLVRPLISDGFMSFCGYTALLLRVGSIELHRMWFFAYMSDRALIRYFVTAIVSPPPLTLHHHYFQDLGWLEGFTNMNALVSLLSQCVS